MAHTELRLSVLMLEGRSLVVVDYAWLMRHVRRLRNIVGQPTMKYSIGFLSN
jgi:hypothetical protein